MQRIKTGGRQAGTPNRITRELRETLKIVIDAELTHIADTMAELPPKDRIDVIIKLMPYCMPRIDSLGAHYDETDVWQM
jgi:23S rRNA C2498 (ribose-2'-O)-methylase RlmM